MQALSINVTSKIIRIISVILLIIVSVGVIYLLVSGAFGVDRYDWTFQRVLAAFGAPIPREITNVVDNSRAGEIVALDVTFTAAPSTVLTFVTGVCDGRLHQRYDPFTAIASAFPDSPNAILIPDEAIHYSDSDNTSDSTFGNQCRQNRAAVLQISVDKTNSFAYVVKLGANFEHGSNFPLTPLAHFELPLDSTSFPLMVVGIYKQGDKFFLLKDQVCMEVRTTNFMRGWGYRPSIPSETLPFIGRDINVLVDGTKLSSVKVNEAGKLVSYTDDGNYQDWKWNYCPYVPATIGRHQITIVILGDEDEVREYSWDYWVGQ